MELAALARDFHRDELRDRENYRFLAARIHSPRLRRELERIADMEARHAGFWERVLRARGATPGSPPRPGLGLRLIGAAARILDPVLLVGLLELGENAAYHRYFETLLQAPLDEAERAELRRIILDELEHEQFFHTQSRALGASSVRDFVLGMNDGLVELLGTVAGLSAVYGGAPGVVGISGLVVGIAGGLSMGIGAFVSVRSERQVEEARRRRARILREVAPQRTAAEVRERLVDAGVDPAAADQALDCLSGRPEVLDGLLASTGPSSDELRSGLLTGGAYLVGAAVPVLPYFAAGSSLAALPWSVGLGAALLAATGGLVAVLSGLRLRLKVVEMLVAGLGAAALSYGFGRLVQILFGVAPP